MFGLTGGSARAEVIQRKKEMSLMPKNTEWHLAIFPTFELGDSLIETNLLLALINRFEEWSRNRTWDFLSYYFQQYVKCYFDVADKYKGVGIHVFL